MTHKPLSPAPATRARVPLRRVSTSGSNATQAGMSTVEFVMVFPVFFTCLLLVIEFSFACLDRHLLSAAGLSAARSLATAPHYRDDRHNLQDNALRHRARQAQPARCQDVYGKDALQKARRAAAFKLAATAPTLSETLQQLGLEGITLPKQSPSLGPIKRLLDGYPTAYLLTRIKNCTVDAQGVKLDLIYLRRGKIPIASRVMWIVYMISTFNDTMGDSLSAYLKADLYGIGLASPQLAALQAHITKTLSASHSPGHTQDIISFSQALTTKVPELAALAGSFAPMAQGIAATAANTSTAVASKLAAINAAIASQEKVLAAALYSIPEEIRLIPLSRTIQVAFSYGGYQRTTTANWQKRGFTYLVAPYQAEAGASNSVVTWESWAKALTTTNFTWRGNDR